MKTNYTRAIPPEWAAMSRIFMALDDRLASLSRREKDVLQEMVRGRQSREIAETLCISIKTVEFHRANIREKLGTTNLADLFRLVFKQE